MGFPKNVKLEVRVGFSKRNCVATPLWGKCEDETHTPKSGNLESFGTLKNLKLDCMGQNTSHGGVLYTIGKVLKCRCLNRPDIGVYRWSATHCWKAFEESYKFSLDLILIRGLSWELWASKVLGVQTRPVSGLLLRSPRTKSHSDVGLVGKHREYYMGEGGGFPQVRAVVSQVSSCCPWLVPTPRLI
jgi:hypothetical protein